MPALHGCMTTILQHTVPQSISTPPVPSGRTSFQLAKQGDMPTALHSECWHARRMPLKKQTA
jgi:hypothetical protein